MELLISKSERRASLVKAQHKRYLFDQIDWEQRLILILGYRGVGKTTLVLQYMRGVKSTAVYFSLDDLYFETHRIVVVVADLYDLGYRMFIFDEVHRYPMWSKDLKQVYDDYPDAQFVATGSSILELSKGNADLSRRAVVYHLHGLSFREYLLVRKNVHIAPIQMSDLLSRHHLIAAELLDSFSYRTDFENYLKHGYFPFFLESKNTYFQRLEETVNMVVETDIPPYEDLQHATVRTMKKLLYVISQSVPFTPNIHKLAERLETTRSTLLRLLDLLDKAGIIHLLKAETKGVSYLQKPEKIYLNNTNFIHLFSPSRANVGNIRETFFYNQVSVVHGVTAAKYGDFMVDDSYFFEVGGVNKGMDQIKGVPNAFLALDVEGGNEKRIPLWLFGMLY